MEKYKRKLIFGFILASLVSTLCYLLINKNPNKTQYSMGQNAIAVYIQDENGKYNLNSAKTFPTDGYELNLETSICKNGSELSQNEITKKIAIKLNNQDSCVLYFKKETPKIIIGDTILKTSTTIPVFKEIATQNETENGLFTLNDEDGPSYYFRGAVDNNYVKFGIDSEGNDMYWRIIRFNGDGSMRIQYDGKANGHSDTDFSYERGFALNNKVWFGANSSPLYLGYMTGDNCNSKSSCQKNINNSNIKTYLEDWYKTNLATNYDIYIEDEVFCNDRSIKKGLGYNTNDTEYGPSGRTSLFYTDLAPSFICPQENDKFTKSTKKGNGKSEYPIGLITADEAFAAGSGTQGKTNQSYYLNKETDYWTISPSQFSNNFAYVISIGADGSTRNPTSNSKRSAAPVINIKAEYLTQMKGDGKATNPFRLE